MNDIDWQNPIRKRRIQREDTSRPGNGGSAGNGSFASKFLGGNRNGGIQNDVRDYSQKYLRPDAGYTSQTQNGFNHPLQSGGPDYYQAAGVPPQTYRDTGDQMPPGPPSHQGPYPPGGGWNSPGPAAPPHNGGGSLALS